MGKFLINLLLLIIAILLFFILSPFGFIWGLLQHGKGYIRTVAVLIDCAGNAVLGYMLNSLLRQAGGYNFGKPDETISSAIGKNIVLGKLSFLGKAINWVLDKIDPGHSLKAIKK